MVILQVILLLAGWLGGARSSWPSWRANLPCLRPFLAFFPRRLWRRRTQLLAKLEAVADALDAKGQNSEGLRLLGGEWMPAHCTETLLDDLDVHLKFLQVLRALGL